MQTRVHFVIPHVIIFLIIQFFYRYIQGLFAKRRMLLLTDGPHLYYVDPATKILKGQIPW